MKTKKLKRGFIPLIIILMLILTSITGFNTVFAQEGTITIENWESYQTGLGSGSSTYITWEHLNDTAFYSFNVTDDWNYSGTKSLNADIYDDVTPAYAGEDYYGNISLNDVWDYIYQIKIYFRIKQTTTLHASYTQVRFEFFNSTNDRVLKAVLSKSNGAYTGTGIFFNGFGVYDFENVLNICPASTTYSDWTELILVITHLDSPIDPNLMQYEIFNIAGFYQYGFEETSNVVDAWTNFSYLKFYGYSHGGTSCVATTELRIDDIILSTEEVEEEPEYGDVSNYSYVGNIDYYDPVFPYIKELVCEEKRFVRMNCDVQAVDLLVSSELYVKNPDLTEYYLDVNGVHIGIPSYWVPYKDDYLLRWIGFEPRTLDNEYPVLEFVHTDYPYADRDWTGIGITRKGDDIDNDLESTHKRHGETVIYMLNGIYDGDLHDGDLIYRMYYTQETFIPPQTYDDIIDTDKNSYKQFETVTIAGSVSTLLYLNRLVVNMSGIEYVNRTIHGYTFSEYFIPTLEGVYNASIYRQGSGIVKTCNFTVTITSLEHYIYTVNNPTRLFESFTVYFNYSYTTIPCAIVLFDSKDLLHPLKRWRYDTVPIEDSFVYSLNTEGIYYFDLCSYHFDNVTNDYVYTTIKRHKHVCKDEYPNQISVALDVVQVGGWEQLVYGSHNFLGSNVFIKMNDEIAFSVNDVSVFELRYAPQYIGEYNASLVLVLSDTNIVLDYVWFSVAGGQPIVPPEPSFFGLPIEYMNGMFGAFITLGFLIIPFALSRSHKGDTSSVIYAIFGGIGLGISTIIGFFPLWLPLMITILVVTILVIEYKKG